MKKIFKDLDIYSIKNYLGKVEDKEGIIKCIQENQRMYLDLKYGYDFALYKDYNNFFNNYYDKIFNDCRKIFNFTPSENNIKVCLSYLSDKLNYAEQWHNHIKTGTITIIYYLNIPKNKTSINFLCEKNERLFTYRPVTDEALILPSYLYHKPNRCYYDGYRVSINVDILCEETSKELFSRIKKPNIFENIFKGILK
jgi:hypothetical protein